MLLVHELDLDCALSLVGMVRWIVPACMYSVTWLCNLGSNIILLNESFFRSRSSFSSLVSARSVSMSVL